MYQDYFGLSDLPFRVTPEPQFLYSNPAHRNAYAALRDAIDSRQGLIVITGEIGTGKTTLLTKFLQSNLDPALQSAVILNPSFSFAELLRFALRDLGIPCSSDSATELLERFNEHAAQEAAKGRNLAVFLDEAQTVSPDVLNELLRLSNLDSDEKKLVQVILIGQPELDQKLNQPELVRLKRRVSLHQTLAPLTAEEVGQYIDFRLRKAGYQGKRLFDPSAVERIVLYSAGIPRLINIICDNALLIAFAVSKKRVSAAIVDEVAEDLHLEAPPVSAQITFGSAGHKPVQSDATTLLTHDKNFFRPELLGQRYASRTLAAGFGILLVFGLLTGASSILYDQGKNLVSSMASGVGQFFGADANSPVRVQSSPQDGRDNVEDSWPDFRQLKMEVTRILMKNKERNPDSSATRLTKDRSKYFDDAQTTVIPAIPSVEDEAPAPRKKRVAPIDDVQATRTIEPTNRRPIPSQPDPQLQGARGPQYWPHQPTGAKPRRADREQRFFQGLFEVTADSLVFDEPRMESALLKTLRPGSQVRVEQKHGNFLLVRSLKDPALSGYVPLEDAYFKRIQ